VGHVSINDAYRRLRNYRQLKGTEIYGNEVVYYVDALVESGAPGVADSLIAIAKEDREVRISLLAGAIELKSPKVGSWLQNNADRLNATGWQIISAAVQRAHWRDSTVMRVLLNEAIHGDLDHSIPHDKIRSRRNISGAFGGVGTFDEVKQLAQLGDTTAFPKIRWGTLEAAARFDHPPFNRRIREVLMSRKEPPVWILSGLKAHNRYDFLPELRAVEKQMPASTSRYTQEKMERVIRHLEEKKAEGAPLGVPLDWPETTWEDKDINEAESKE